ncbi:hypothetical protein JCM10450v2_005666 [Rhodotorula kratochvilovae]
MFGRPANPYDEVVAKATDEKQTEINWEVALGVCDKVNDDGEPGARNCIAALQKRFTHRSANVQLFSLTLATALVNNCGPSVHREISGKAFTQALTRLVNDRTTHDTVKKEALKQIETWVKEHPNNTDFDLLVETYEALKRQGHNFHPDRPATPKGPSEDDLLRREEEELQRALAESAALADPKRNFVPSSSSGRARSPSPSPAPLAQQGPRFVRGLYDFEGETADELPFRRGETLRVVERVSDEWCRGELRGRVGIFPMNYVEELPDDPSQQPQQEHALPLAPPAAADPAAAEAEIFAQAAAVDKLLALMHQLRARGEDFADNEELTDLYNSSMALRPRVVQLIRKYEQKQADLYAMSEKVDRAKATYEQLAGLAPQHAHTPYAQPNGYPAAPHQQQQQPPLDVYGRPYDPHAPAAAAPYDPHAQPGAPYDPHAAAAAAQHPSPHAQQQQQQYAGAPAPQQHQAQAVQASAEDEAQREYERQLAEYERKLAEYNAQMAALQQGQAGPPAQAQAQAQGAEQPQPVWDAQANAWVWPAQVAGAPPPHHHQQEAPAPAPALSPAPAQGYPAQTQPYAHEGTGSPAPHPQQQQQGYASPPPVEQMAALALAPGAGSPPPAHAYAPQQAYGAGSPPPAQAGHYASPPPVDEGQQQAWASWHAQQQQQGQQGYAAAPGPGSVGGR